MSSRFCKTIFSIICVAIFACSMCEMEAAGKKQTSKRRRAARTSQAAPKPKASVTRAVGATPVVEETLLSPKHEMRGAWFATVYGIDWPSKQGATAAIAQEQKRELCEILDILKEAGINAVMFQVRSMSDAMYRSSFEPWSAYLTGERGLAPADGFDPLAFAVEEAHKRGMELHAWVNPYRLANGVVPPPVKAANGGATFNPKAKGWTITYAKPVARGEKRTSVSVLDPGNPQVRRHVVDVCRDIVTRYDVDGLVFDDYFYPDRLPLGSGYDFADYQQYLKTAGKDAMSQADWRRNNVALTVAEVHKMLAEERPWVRFGISPAGVAGGNGKSANRYNLPLPEVGSDWMYDRIYCDPLPWLAEGTVDYVSPQIYWASDHSTNPYAPLARWWGDVAERFNRHCYPSQSVGVLPEGDEAWAEQGYQIGINRQNSGINDAGSIFYSTAHISGKKMRGLGGYLISAPYRNPALLPTMTWKEAANPGVPESIAHKGNLLRWTPQPNMRYVVYAIPKDVSLIDALAEEGENFDSKYILGVTYSNTYTIPTTYASGYWYAIAPYDRYGNEWDAAVIGME